jgi:hypothetical protein
VAIILNLLNHKLGKLLSHLFVQKKLFLTFVYKYSERVLKDEKSLLRLGLGQVTDTFQKIEAKQNVHIKS